MSNLEEKFLSKIKILNVRQPFLKFDENRNV
jgi:hypothetical protein